MPLDNMLNAIKRLSKEISYISSSLITAIICYFIITNNLITPYKEVWILLFVVIYFPLITIIITLMAKSGMSLLQIQTHTGHKSLKALKKYSHLTHEDIKDEVTHTLSIEKPSRKPITKPEPQPEIITEKQPQQQVTTQENKDKYIELLKQGLISKEDFFKLMGIKNKDDNVMFG